MATLVCTASAEEMSALMPALFPTPETIKEFQPIVQPTAHGSLIFLVTGVGPINAALAIGFCLGLKFGENKDSDPVSAILYTGLAGAFDLERNPLCSIRVVRKEIWPEYGLHDGISVTARAFRFPLWTRKDTENIYDTVELAGSGIFIQKMPSGWEECSSLTVAGVSASFARRDSLWNKWRADLENMEGFSAAYAALRGEIPCVEVRIVSNKVGPRGRHEKDFSGALSRLSLILPALNLG